MSLRKKLLALLLMILMGIMSACGKNNNMEVQNSAEKEETTQVEDSVVTKNTTGKGRYVESVIELPSEFSWCSEVYQQEDGSIKFFDLETMQQISSNTQISEFEVKAPDFLKELSVTYIDTLAISPDGAYMIEYVPKTTEDEQEENNSDYNPEYAYVSADGEVVPIELNSDKNAFASKFDFTEDGRIIMTDYRGSVLEINKDNGSMKELFTGSESFCAFNIVGNYIVAIDNKNIYIYNLLTDELCQNPEALVRFLDEQGIERIDEGPGYNAFCFGKDTDDAIYILDANGLYRYVMNGSSVEQLIDGKLCTIGNPSFRANSFIQESDGSFVIFYGEGKLIRYTYDPEMPSVPETVLKVFSLKLNKTVNQAISEFQKQNPDVYVTYEVGITNEDSVTSEDALKNLNTEILSGNGPDILLLDDIRIDNYIKKDMLVNLDEYKDVINPDNKLLTNITECFRKENGLFAMPARFRIPVIVSSTENLNKVKDLQSLADLTEELYTDDTKSPITGLYSEEEVLRMALIYEGNEIEKDNGVDENKLKDMLTCAKRIYSVELKTTTEEERKERAMSWEDAQISDEDWAYNASGRGPSILMGYGLIATGVTSSFHFDLNMIASIHKADNSISYRYGLSNGKSTFIPECLMGISTSSGQKDTAAKFIATVLSNSVQDIDTQDGFAVNLDSIQKEYDDSVNNSESDGMIGTSNSETGKEFTLQIYYPDQEELKEFDSMIHSMNKPYILDKVVKDTILDIGPDALNGSISIDEAVNEISGKIKIRMAE